jgi:hypothetical protein
LIAVWTRTCSQFGRRIGTYYQQVHPFDSGASHEPVVVVFLEPESFLSFSAIAFLLLILQVRQHPNQYSSLAISQTSSSTCVPFFSPPDSCPIKKSTLPTYIQKSPTYSRSNVRKYRLDSGVDRTCSQFTVMRISAAGSPVRLGIKPCQENKCIFSFILHYSSSLHLQGRVVFSVLSVLNRIPT